MPNGRLFTTAQTRLGVSEMLGAQESIKPMRFIHLFLVGYAVLAVGGVVAMWQLGILGRLTPVWIVVGALAIIGVGIMVSVSSGKPAITSEVPR